MDYGLLRVLVVDDEQFSRFAVGTVLRLLGVKKVVEARDGASAMEAYAAFWPHLVICDLEMKPVDGMTFLRLLKEQEKHLHRVAPVIFLTVHAEGHLVHQAMELGAAGYLVKPVKAPQLKKRMDSLLANTPDLYGDLPRDDGPAAG
ncbi:response regulator [Magnetospirillum sp. SS-4]|uniref:response regulator n=1 Tax=Magnetospirillum sp. SS-4 TaxID=2681465 RepID=UPI00137E2377|nr:response regulator [Magnetospirillum sp. SS-4]CAA7623596.1 CheY-like receiver protein [Magnetospirillum sp. SS-4]